MPFDKHVLQAGATSGNGAAYYAGPIANDVTVYTRGTGTITGGTVLIEESSDPSFAGTWVTVATITASTLSNTSGAEAVTRIAGAVGAIRARISSAITGGGVIDAVVIGR